MKLYQILLASLAVTATKTEARSADTLTHQDCISDAGLRSTTRCQMIESTYQKMFEENRIKENQQRYLDGEVQMEMLYGQQVPKF